MWLNPQFPADLVTLTVEFLNGKVDFLRSDFWENSWPEILQNLQAS